MNARILLVIVMANISVSCSEITTRDLDENERLNQVLKLRLDGLKLKPLALGETVDVQEKGLCYLPMADSADSRVRRHAAFSHHDADLIASSIASASRDTNYPRSILVVESYTEKKLFIITRCGRKINKF